MRCRQTSRSTDRRQRAFHRADLLDEAVEPTLGQSVRHRARLPEIARAACVRLMTRRTLPSVTLGSGPRPLWRGLTGSSGTWCTGRSRGGDTSTRHGSWRDDRTACRSPASSRRSTMSGVMGRVSFALGSREEIECIQLEALRCLTFGGGPGSRSACRAGSKLKVRRTATTGKVRLSSATKCET